VWIFLATKVISSVGNAMSQAAFPLVIKNEFGLGEKGLGLCMSGMNACSAVVNGFLLSPILKMLGRDLLSIIKYCLVAMTLLAFL